MATRQSGWSPCSGQLLFFSLGREAFCGKSVVVMLNTTTLKRIFPVTSSRSFCLQDSHQADHPPIPHIIPAICLSRRNARSTGWLGNGKASASRARSHREDAPMHQQELACRRKGRRVPKRENGRRMSVLFGAHLTRAAILEINSPMFHARPLPAGGCRVDLPFAGSFMLHMHSLSLTAAGADEWLCHWLRVHLLLLHCAVHVICKWPAPSCGILTNPSCYAWLSAVAVALAGWLSRKHAGRFCDRPDAIVVCTRQAGINTKGRVGVTGPCVHDRQDAMDVWCGFLCARVLIARLVL